MEDVVLDVMERHRMLAAYTVLNEAGPEDLADLRTEILELLISWTADDNETGKPQYTLSTEDKIAVLQKL